MKPGFTLWKVSNQWQRAQRAALAPLGLTHVQYALLDGILSLAAEKSPVTQKKLADRVHADPMMTSQVLRTLESRSLLARRSHPTDKRAMSVELTPKAKKLMTKARSAVNSVDQQFFQAVDTESFVEALSALGPQ